jgi:hypothetical protein
VRVFIIILLSFTSCGSLFSQSSTQALLNQLDSLIEHRDDLVRQKQERIDAYKLQLKETPSAEQFAVLEKLYEEYKSFIYDSAFTYAVKLQAVARKERDAVKVTTSKLYMGFVLASGGLLNEAMDTLYTIPISGMPDSLKEQYYYTMVKTCYDLAAFVQNHYYGVLHSNTASIYADTAMMILPPNTTDYLMVKGLRLLHDWKMEDAKQAYESLIENHPLTDHEFAIVAATLSYIYTNTKDLQQSREMLIKAAIADVRTNTKETYAILKLAEVLHEEGDIEGAYKYIKIALDDANFYGARQRKVQVAALFPKIEADRLAVMEAKRNLLMLYALIVTLSAIAIMGVLYLIKKQNNKLQKARRIISKANRGLREANMIKEEYLWYYFNSTADYIAKLDALKSTIEVKVASKKIDDLKFAAFNINIKSERNTLFHNFDQVFLKLFPNFVDVFNSLLIQEHRVTLANGQLLNTELRIFALLRLGVHDHEKIAKILGYSLTTIYTYKTRVKSKAHVSSEEFDRALLNIPAIGADYSDKPIDPVIQPSEQPADLM